MACFDNDGTLCVEKPLPPQLDFIFGAWQAEIRAAPSLGQEQPYKGLAEGDSDFFADVSRQDPEAIQLLEEAIARTWKGLTPAQFESDVRAWAATQHNARFDRPATDLIYQPMRELFDLLRANDFRVFICSGGGRDFMRVFALELWGMNLENVIGSAPELEYVDGRILRTDRVYGAMALGPGKPAHIFARTGQLPLLAGGNADIDMEMLASARFALLIDHDDAEREYAYTTGAEQALARAPEGGWAVVSMKDDWNQIFT
ncbi:MAG: HAD family hydrolase [Candidatus Nanopelagicales bacterium]